jgi:hypothetical protein
MVRFDLRDIDPARDGCCYGVQDIANVVANAQLQMLRYRRRALWCREQMITCSLIWALLLAFFWISDFLSAMFELTVLLALGGGVVALFRGVQQNFDSYNFCVEVNRNFAEVGVEHYCDIDQLCKEHPLVSRYIDGIAESGRGLTYYELYKLAGWLDQNRTGKHARISGARVLRESIGLPWSRRQPGTIGD